MQELEYLTAVIRECAWDGVDLIHAQWLRVPEERYIFSLLNASGVPFVWTAHNAFGRRGDARGTGEAYAAMYRLAKGVVVHTLESREVLRREVGLDPERIFVIRPGMPLGRRGTASEKELSRRSFGLPADGVVYLFYGQLRAYKGWEVLLDAFAAAINTGADAWLLVVGKADGAQGKAFKAHVETLETSVQGRVVTVVREDDFVDEEVTRDAFWACDCVVLPYAGVTFSAVLLQAYAHGRPVIASRLRGFEESVEEGVTGYLTPPCNVAALAAALMKHSEDRATLLSLAERVRDEAARKHNWSRAASETLRAYRTVLGGA